MSKKPNLEIKRTPVGVFFKDGKKVTFTIITESREGYNDEEMHAWIPPHYNTYLESINGSSTKGRPAAKIYGDRVTVLENTGLETYERTNKSKKHMRFDEAADEYNSMSATEQMESYVSKIEGFDYEGE